MGAPFTEGYTYQDNLLHEYQHKLGHDVTIITSTYQRGTNGQIFEGICEDKMMPNGVRLIRLKPKFKIQRIIGLYPNIKKILNDIKPDFIYVHGLASHIPQYVIDYKKQHLEIHLIADNHQDEGTTYTEKFPFNIILKYYKIRWKKWIYYFDKVYGVTSWRVKFAHDIYGIPFNKLDTLIMGIDEDKFPQNFNQVRKNIRRELKISEDTFVFITGGKLDNRKKIIEILNAFRELPQNNVRLIIFGTPSVDIKDTYAKKVKNDKRIIDLGYIDSSLTNKYFIASDFGLFPGRHSVLWEEAIGCGLPCLFKKYEENDHTDVCGNCIRMENITVNDILIIMIEMISNHDYYLELKRKALEAKPFFSYRNIAKKSLETQN